MGEEGVALEIDGVAGWWTIMGLMLVGAGDGDGIGVRWVW